MPSTVGGRLGAVDAICRQVACIYLTWVGWQPAPSPLQINLPHTLPPPAAGAGARGAARRRADGGSRHHHPPAWAGVTTHCPGQFGFEVLLLQHSSACTAHPLCLLRCAKPAAALHNTVCKQMYRWASLMAAQLATGVPARVRQSGK